MNINHHLLKENPLYITPAGDVVKLVLAIKTDKGLNFTAEIMSGENKGKWTSVYKRDLKIYKGAIIDINC